MADVSRTPDEAHGDEPVEFTHDGAGTPEREWARWPGLRDVAELDWRGVEHLLVVAAHPDDETLGAGGLIATAAARGLAVDVLVATDGEASHPSSPTTTPQALAELRVREVHRAIAQLGSDVVVHRLGWGDGALAAAEDALAERIAELLRPASLVVAPWAGDAHPDHEAAGRAAARAANSAGARCLQYPVWAWHWSWPGDPRVPWAAGTRVELGAEAVERKQAAMAEHVSQTRPLSDQPGDEVLLPPKVLEHFDRTVEFFLAPAGASAGQPASLGTEFFDGFYAENGDDPWGFEDRWYEQRKRAITLASLPRPRFSSALEVGCSAGVFTAELAPRCDRLLAVDIADSALHRARDRVEAAGHGDRVELAVAAVPQDFPDGRFDLVVLAEVAYYCGTEDLRLLVDRARSSLTDDGVLVACHWRHLVEGYPLTGDEVHRVLRSAPGLDVLARHEEEDFLLDVLVRPPAVSVARAGCLVL